MKKYIIIEAICIALTLLFVISSVGFDRITTKSAEDIANENIGLLSDKTSEKRDVLFIREKLDIDTELFSSVSYYSSDDIMNVNEIFVGVLKEKNSDAVKEAFEKYQSDKYKLFNGYAAEQAAILNSYVYDEVSGAVIFIVAENADEIHSVFLNALE